MDTKIIDGIISEIKNKLGESVGVRLFADHGSRFEQWLQIEICGLLNKLGMVTIPEKSDSLRSIDVSFKDKHNAEYLIELKVVGLQSKYGEKSKATTLKGVYEDINEFPRRTNVGHIVLFATFPGSIKDNKEYFPEIKKSVFELKSEDFKFYKENDSELTGCLYWGLIK